MSILSRFQDGIVWFELAIYPVKHRSFTGGVDLNKSVRLPGQGENCPWPLVGIGVGAIMDGQPWRMHGQEPN